MIPKISSASLSANSYAARNNVAFSGKKTASAPANEDKTKKHSALKTAAFVAGAIALGAYIYKQRHVDLSKIDFSQGTAKLKNGKLYSGVISDTLSNGDKIKLQYKNGELLSSARKGSVNLIKTYENTDSGKVVTTVKDGVTSKANLDELKALGEAKRLERIAAQAKDTASAVQQTIPVEPAAAEIDPFLAEMLKKLEQNMYDSMMHDW